MVALNLRDFPEDLRKRAKIQAAIEEIPLKELVIKAVEEYLKKKGGK